MRTIELTPTNYKSHLPLDIMACSYAYAGAMGEGGCIRFLDREGTLYHLNYCRDEWSFGQLDEMFPFSSCDPGLSQPGTAAPGWNAYSMGMGNFLYIHDCLNESFLARLEQEDYFLFRDWIGIVRKLLLEILYFREAAPKEIMNE